MYCIRSLLKTTAIVCLAVPMAVTAAVLEISPHPNYDPVTPLKPGDTVRFLIKNNAPKAHTIDSLEADGATVTGCLGQEIPAGQSCEVSATINAFGWTRVRAGARKGLYRGISNPYPAGIRIATYNLSFDRDCLPPCNPTGFELLKAQMAVTPLKQADWIKRYEEGSLTGDEEEFAKKIIQIQNVAEVIQRTNPDVFILAEFDNNGLADDPTAINDFQTNYLSVAQHKTTRGIEYPHKKDIPTNTGDLSDHDMNNDGKVALPDDGWGFGNYHGQYAFAIFSKYPFGDGYRSFKNFKWSSMPGEENPVIDICNNPDIPIPEGKACGDRWYSDAAWSELPVSSKNHVDLSVMIPDQNNQPTAVHMLVSHPTPPVFDASARRNYKRNRAEVKFWNDYVRGENYFVDDNGSGAMFESGSLFVIAGDLNADPDQGDGDRATIAGLMNSNLINTAATVGSAQPTSKGGQEYLNSSDCSRNCNRGKGNTITSVSGLRLDHAMPSAGLTVMNSGVYWPATGEPGRHLVYDDKLGSSKGVSSDHRMVWIDVYIPVDAGKKTGP